MQRIFEAAGEPVRANPAIPLHRYVAVARRLLEEANRHGAVGEVARQAVLLVRFNSLVLETLPQHPAWRLEQNRALREALRAKAAQVLDDLERFREEAHTSSRALATMRQAFAAVPGDDAVSVSWSAVRVQELEGPPPAPVPPERTNAMESLPPTTAASVAADKPAPQSPDNGTAMTYLQSEDDVQQRLRQVLSRSGTMTELFCRTWNMSAAERHEFIVRGLLAEAGVALNDANYHMASAVLNDYRLVRATPSWNGGGATDEYGSAAVAASGHVPGAAATRDEAASRNAVGPWPISPDKEMNSEEASRTSLATAAAMAGPDEQPAGPDGDTPADGAVANTPPDAAFGEMWLKAWHVGFDDLVVGPKIGSGGYGEVFVGKHGNRLVAIKHLQPVDGVYSPELLRSFREEMILMSGLSHPNIVRFMGACTRPPYLCILTEYVHGGTLYRLLQKRRRRRVDPVTGAFVGGTVVTEFLPWCGIVRLALGVARGMCYLHSQNPVIVHRDLKSPNCLVFSASSPVPVDPSAPVIPEPSTGGTGGPIRHDADFGQADVKLIDFGLSRTQLKSYISTGIAGTPEWMAPEIMRQERVNQGADVFSFGVILWELITGERPWEQLTQTQVVYRVGYLGETLPIPPDTHKALAELVQEAFASNPHERPGFPAIVERLEQLARETAVDATAGEALLRARINGGHAVK
ncbi:hypothetical protein CDCA_CDCA18G4501 [Cyanidium caldarium]|uniref:Protein kinase domain-containing protein n=1 Tax=Cyanidium caldarium TaxID=2771 RepID=A0AAV9J275_CYACA|nr:hypothetical protein CDCA_CDCA18G4501 [Cyanidium caldarium]